MSNIQNVFNKKEREQMLRRHEREQIKKNKALEIKKGKKMYQDEFKEINKMIQSERMKLMHSEKKIKKFEKTLNELKEFIEKNEANKQCIVNIDFYVEKKENTSVYSKTVIRFSNDGSKYAHYDDFVNVVLKRKDVDKYNVDEFYNNSDQGEDDINKFISIVKKSNEEINERITAMEQSIYYTGFIITQRTDIEMIPEKKDFDLLGKKYKNDENQKGINTKYTSYKINTNSKSFKELINIEYNDYIKQNFRPRSCLLTAIIQTFYKKFNTIKSSGKRAYKELTYSNLCKILEIPDQPSDNEVDIYTVIDKFFKCYNFATLYVYDAFMKCIKVHKARDEDHEIAMRILLKDGHVYLLNKDVKSLQQKVNYDDDERSEITVNDKYNIMKTEMCDDIKEVFCNDEKEIFDEIIKTTKEKEKTRMLKIITSCNMNELLITILNAGYTPKFYFSSFLWKITMRTEQIETISIETCDNNPIYGNRIILNSLQEYKEFNATYNKLYENIIKKEYISDYHESVREIHNTYKIRPLVGYFNEHKSTPTLSLDENKAYSECLMNIKQIPIFHYFDVYLPYNNEKIEDLTYYIVEILESSNESAILFDGKISRTYGFVLNSCNVQYKILFQRKPFKIEEVDYKTPVLEVFQSKLPTDMKKIIVNKLTGMLELKFNKGHVSKLFTDADEAESYKVKYNGKVLPIVINSHEELTSKTYGYMVNIHEQKQLIQGLCPIKDIIYLRQKVKMYHLYNKLIKLGVDVLGVRTDCFLFTTGEKKIKKTFKLTKEIGDYKIEYNKYVPDVKIQLEMNELIKFQDYTKIDEKQFEDEKDTKAINEYLKDKQSVLIKGIYPGVGKSTLCKKFDKNALFILPYNRLCQNVRMEGYDAITYSKGFGLYKDDQEIFKQFDFDDYNTIIFDEALLYTPDRLKRIAKLIQQYPNKKFFATGDTDQRDPIGFENSEYLKHCMKILFPTHIILNDIKRLVNEEDKQKLKNLKQDIFYSSLSIEEICKKHKLNTVSNIYDVKTIKNICYFNFRCENVNTYIHRELLKKTYTYENGAEIICKKYEKKGAFTLNTNYMFKIKKLGTKTIIRDEVDDIDYEIPRHMLQSHFRLPYALSCDSCQGLSFGENEKITIFDSNLPYCDRKFLWTAITRARKLDNVTIFIHSNNEVEQFSEAKIKQYFKLKCDGYKMQDSKAKREYKEDEYIDEKWIAETLKTQQNKCFYCNCTFNFEITSSASVNSNLTVDRKISKGIAHIKRNCVLSCLHCNCSKNNR
jgi:hypothetical protein